MNEMFWHTMSAYVRCAASDAGWSSLVARRAHNPKVVGSNPAPATRILKALKLFLAWGFFRLRTKCWLALETLGSRNQNIKKPNF